MKKYQNFIGKRVRTKIYGFIPVRMKASRFPGKPLKKILNKTMLEHVFERAKMYKNWEKLLVTTCDKKIISFSKKKIIHILKPQDIIRELWIEFMKQQKKLEQKERILLFVFKEMNHYFIHK